MVRVPYRPYCTLNPVDSWVMHIQRPYMPPAHFQKISKFFYLFNIALRISAETLCAHVMHVSSLTDQIAIKEGIVCIKTKVDCIPMHL